MKAAVVLFISTPLLGQAGISIEKDVELALQLYTTYVEELLSLFNGHPTIDVLFSCEEKFQSVLISNHFVRSKNCLVYSGSLGKKLAEITHYCGDYQDYDFIFICPKEFTLITPALIESYIKRLQRTKRSVLVVSNNQQSLDLIGLNFPFQTIYQDIIWQKDDVVGQIKTNLKHQSIPCISVTSEIVWRTKAQYSEQMSSAYPKTCAILKGNLNS